MAQAETDVILALYISESFVEAHLSHNQKLIHFNRWYLGKEGLKGGLQKFFLEAGIEKARKAFVASRFVEKIFAYRLGGSVAILTTQGFENWPGLRQPVQQKAAPLSSADLMFSVEERCTADGHIEKEVSEADLSALIEKLRQKQAKRICIHFLNAAKNPHNQNRVKEALVKENFEVFLPAFCPEDPDEVSAWRRNILNASVSGTFEEVQEELNEGLKPFLPEGERAAFFSSEATLFDREGHLRLSSLWGAYGAWARSLKKQNPEKFNILFLGLEQFCLLNPEKQTHIWQSPWGHIHMPQVHNQPLSLQPTTVIELSPWGELSFGTQDLGFEPGPMFMGRGQIPTLLDLWSESTGAIQGVGERRSPTGLQKFKNQLWALNKTSSNPIDSEDQIVSRLREVALQKLTLSLAMQADSPKIICLGALAPVFVPEFKKRLSHFQFELRPETETAFLLSQGHEHAL